MTTSQVQTAYAQHAVIGVPGDAYDSEPHSMVTKIAAEVIPYGTWVSFTAEETCELPDSAAEITNIHGGGVAMRDPNAPSGSTGYAVGDPVRVMVRGRVFVLAEVPVVITDTPFARHTAGTGSQKGAFLIGLDTNTAATPANTRFYRGGTVAQPPVLEIK